MSSVTRRLQVGQWGLAVAPGAGIAEMALDDRAEAETFIEFARKQETRIGRDRSTAELDAQLRVE